MAFSPRSDRAKRERFESLAMPLAPALYATALRLTRRPDDAADCVQETYLRALRTFSGFRPGTNAKAWLFTILYSILSNRWQRSGREPAVVSIDDLAERFEREFDLPDGDAHLEVLRRAGVAGPSPEVEEALGALPEVFRAAILLVDLEGLTYEEAASVAGVPVGTLRSRLFRGRKMLATALRDWARRTGRVER